MRELPHAYTNRMLGNERIVIKRYQGPGAASRRDRECDALRRLRGRLPVPAVLATDDDNGATFERMPGIPGQEVIRAGKARSVLGAGGTVLRQLHRLDRPGRWGVGAGPVFVHGDFGPNNLLVSHDGARATALLDWEWAHFADPVEDLAWCWPRRSPGTNCRRSAIRERVQVSWARCGPAAGRADDRGRSWAVRDMQGRSALVTGASSEIGAAVARRLVAAGARVVLSGHHAQRVEAVAAELAAAGPRPECLLADLADAGEAARLATDAERICGGVDVLAHVAGFARMAALDDMADDDVIEQVSVNLTAPLIMIRRLLPGMLARGRGHLVLVGSLAGLVGGAYQVPYAAAKAGLDRAVQALREEHRGGGVGFSIVHPGPVRRGDRRVPWIIGETTAPRVANAVIHAIRRSSPQVLVVPRPARALLTAAAASPTAAAALLRRAGATRYAQSLTGARE